MPYLVLAITGLLILSIIQTAQTRHFATELRNGLVESCQKNGNPLREAVQKTLSEQITQTRATDLHRFFPQIPPDELQALIREQNQQREELIAEIEPVDCASLYPRP